MTRFWGQKVYAWGPREYCPKMKARIWANNQFKKEFFMSHREMNRYWNDYHSMQFEPLNCYSRFLSFKKRQSLRKCHQQCKIFIRKVTHI